MTEWLESGINKYCLRDRLTDKDETWELWQGFREIAMLRYKTGPEIIDFNGEWLGWGDLIPKLYLEVRIPAQVEFHGRALEEKDVESLAAKVHLVLCSMKHRNVVVRQRSWAPLPEADRERFLEDFQQWMEQRGWKVTIDRDVERISIKTRGWPFFRRKASEREILDRGARVAEAFPALLYKELDRTVLFVSEGARPVSSWLAEVIW